MNCKSFLSSCHFLTTKLGGGEIKFTQPGNKAMVDSQRTGIAIVPFQDVRLDIVMQSLLKSRTALYINTDIQ